MLQNECGIIHSACSDGIIYFKSERQEMEAKNRPAPFLRSIEHNLKDTGEQFTAGPLAHCLIPPHWVQDN